MAEEAKQKGESPVIRATIRDGEGFKEVLALWPKKDGSEGKHDLSGTLEGKRVSAFIRHPEGKPPFVSLRAQDENGEFVDAGSLNAINRSKENKPVYFDTLVLGFADKDRNVAFARVTHAMSDELHAKIGFTSPRVARPKRQADESPREESEGLTPA